VTGDSACRLCGHGASREFLVRRGVPVHQNLILPTREAARAIPRGDLEMCVCETCGFVFNRAFDPSLLSYGEAYDNDQTCSPEFRAYLDALERRILVERGVRASVVVEVGCGNGAFLERLVRNPEIGNTGHGFDPAYRGPDTAAEGRLRFRRAMYGPDCRVEGVAVVICRHVVEHVPEPLALLEDVRGALEHAADPKLFFETPCVDWILQHRVVWDFFYEHCSLFSTRSLAFAFERAGFGVERVGHVFGGQYLWLEAGRPRGESVPPRAGETAALSASFSAHDGEVTNAWRRTIGSERRRGPVALWGAGAKGVTLANLVDPDGELIDCVVDLNPRKQGNFLPGTGHPIVAPEALGPRGVVAAVPMNPNYRDENATILARAGLAVRLVEGA
jgi:SAM-dependent methyltransferase